VGSFDKYDIIKMLAGRYGLRRFLEICTPTTGGTFDALKSAKFEVAHRLMYRCQEHHEDGRATTYRTTVESSHELVRTILAAQPGISYDIVFVDPFHTYRCSITDLYGAAALLAPNGILVVHDCNPTDATIVGPEYQKGSWCGVTYQAFVDFLLGYKAGGYCTVDTDFGCGVVFSGGANVPQVWKSAGILPRLALDWSVVRLNNDQRFKFFEKHRQALLNLVSPADFAKVYPSLQAKLSTADTQPVNPETQSVGPKNEAHSAT
jgi:hypothetical protein